MAEAEHALQHVRDGSPGHHATEGTQGRRVLDAVFEHRPVGGVLVRSEEMRVGPGGEGPGDLVVGELLAFDEVAVLGHPSDRERPRPHAQHHPIAIVDAAGRLDPRGLEGRKQPPQRARPRVIVEEAIP